MVKHSFLLVLFMIICLANLVNAQVKTGAEQTNEYFPFLSGKKLGLVVNQTSVIGKTQLIDSLLHSGMQVVKIFTPEHGLQGNVSAGEKVGNSYYGKTKIPVISLYGDKKKPAPEDLKGLDLVVFDIQDMGVRFFTYISTLAYVMEACAENNVSLMVLDRPNPHAYYVDGPVLKPAYTSFVGLHPVPVVYGMTIGEYALMVNGEGWLKNGIRCKLKVISLSGYDHDTRYYPEIPPSPNLRTREAMILYPSLCFFEGTDVSVGRGTGFPFEVIGKPGFTQGNFTFTPQSIPGIADKPLYEGKTCSGFKLTDFANEFVVNTDMLYLHWLIGFYDNSPDKETFFNSFFDKLAGTDELRKQIIAGEQPENIRKSWQSDINQFLLIRKKYLLYPDATFKGQMLELKPSK
ncbi:MAG: DUF1343 domain-containing protein [Sphingobacteriales bacterium]|nr:DUF1343 domain-containing protein [Sphingobacteriales bacterium]